MQFVIRHDKQHVIKPLSLHTAQARHLLSDTEIPGDLFSTMILMDADKKDVFIEEKAAIRILDLLGGRFKILAVLANFFPQILLKKLYKTLAKNRYIFGESKECQLSNENIIKDL